MQKHVPFKQLQERLVLSRGAVFGNGMPLRGKALAWVATTAFVAAGLANVVLPPERRWIGLILLGIEFAALLGFHFQLRSFHRSGRSKELTWFEEYDELAIEDGLTIDWIATFERTCIVRSLQTVKERSIFEDLAYNLFFGPAAKVGLLAVIGIVYTQVDAQLSHDLSIHGIVVRLCIAATIGVMYAISWSVTLQHARRDRLKLMLEFGLEQVDEKAHRVRTGAEE